MSVNIDNMTMTKTIIYLNKIQRLSIGSVLDVCDEFNICLIRELCM